MSRLDDAIEFYNQVMEARGSSIVQPCPTEENIKATETALGFIFPPSFRRFIIASHYYGFFRADLNHPNGLVYQNRFFHEDSSEHYLPKFLILFMGGHDGDCNCFDSRFRDDNGECPVVFWDAENMTEKILKVCNQLNLPFLSF